MTYVGYPDYHHVKIFFKSYHLYFQHTTVLPFLLVEKYLVYREYPNRRKGLAIMLGFALAYLLW